MNCLHRASLSWLFLLLCPASVAFAQTDTLNAAKAAGKKNGVYKVYLDQNADPTDSANAYFYGFERWDNGQYVFRYNKHKQRFPKMKFDGAVPEKGRPVALDGKFTWYDEKGQLRDEESYKKGAPFFIRSYDWDTGDSAVLVFSEICYFDRLYQDTPGTFYYEEIGYGGQLHYKGWFRKEEGGSWKLHKIKD